MIGYRPAILAVAAAATLAGSAAAQSYTWSGSGGNANWSTPGNWAGGVPPVSGIDTVVIADGFPLFPVNENQNIANPFVLNSLRLANGFAVGGGALEFRTNSTGVGPTLLHYAGAATISAPVTLADTLTYVPDQNVATGTAVFTLGGVVGGPGGLTVGGFGAASSNVLQLTAAATYTGPTVVNGSILSLEGAGSVLATSGWTVSGVGQLNVTASQNRIADDAVVTMAGGVLRVSGGTERIGTLAVRTGTALVDTTGTVASALSAANPLARSPGGVLRVGLSGSGPAITFDTPPALVGGNGPANGPTMSILPYVTKAGSLATYDATGIRRLNLQTEFATTIVSGTTTFNNVLAGGTIAGIDAPTQVNAIQLTGTINGTGRLTVFSGAILAAATQGTISVGTLDFGPREGLFLPSSPPQVSGYQLSVLSNIVGTGGVTVATPTVLWGANTFSGGLFLSDAALDYGRDEALGAPTNVVTLAKGTLRYIGTPVSTMARNVSVVQPTTVSSQNANALTLSGVVSGDKLLTLDGFVELTNPANSFTGGVAGQFRVGSDAPLGAPASPVTGTLRATAAFTLAHPFSGAIDTNGFDLTATNVLAGGTVTKMGVGTLTVTSTGAIGPIDTQRGTLVVPSAGVAAGIGNILFSGGTLRLTGSGLTTNRYLYVGPFQGNASRFEAVLDTNGQPVTLTGTVGTTTDATVAVITKLGAGDLTIAPGTGQLSRVAAVNVNGGFLVLGPANAAANGTALTFDSGGLRAAGAFTVPQALTTNAGGVTIDTNGFVVAAARLAGPGGLTKAGAGQLTLSGSVTYTGATAVIGGRLVIAAPAASAGYTVGATAALRVDGGTLTVGLGNIQAAADGVVEYYAATVNGGFLRGPGTHTVVGPATFNGSTFQSGVQVNQLGPATLVNVTAAGALTNAAGATLTWDAGAVTASGTFTVNGTANVGNWSSVGDTTVNPGGRVNNTTGSAVVGGGSRTYIGSPAVTGGTLALAAGTTLEMNGALVVNNGTVIGTTNINFNSLGKGAGTWGQVNVNDGGRFSPGNSPGTATTAGANWAARGVYSWEINALAEGGGIAGGPVGWDLWNAGTLNASASFVVEALSLTPADALGTLVGWNPSQPHSWLIATSTNNAFTPTAVAGLSLDASQFAAQNPLGTGRLFLSGTGSDLFLNFSPVPEPGALSLVGLAAVVAVARRVRRRRAYANSSRIATP
ncbi:MAG: autotransporter-associated beta strand repeat-containing protein [Gemmataceae bacterium]